MHFESSIQSIQGRRSNNEDACCAEPALGLYAVADGMGGYEGGEIASNLAIDALRGFYRRNQSDDNCTWPYPLDRGLSLPENQLSVALRVANGAIAAQRKGRLSSMGSTAAVLALVPGSGGATFAVLGHLGDSRVYRVRPAADGAAGAQVEQLTRDHSLYEEMAAARVPDLMPRDQCPFANVITRALGITGDVQPSLRTELVRPGDTFLLCTDGLSNRVPPALLAEVLSALPPEEACARLTREAFDRGEKDNITAVVLRAHASAPGATLAPAPPGQPASPRPAAPSGSGSTARRAA